MSKWQKLYEEETNHILHDYDSNHRYEKGFHAKYVEWLEKKLDTSLSDKWIDVNDRLPEKDGACLVYVKEGYGYFYQAKFFNGYGFERLDPADDDKRHTFITHWQPLPEPPKEEK